MTFPAVVDYSYGRPSPSSIKAAGYSGAMRYLGGDSRCITPSEAGALLGAGLGIGLIWETTANRALDGRQAGVDDAHKANDCATRCGAPDATRIYYAVDFGPTPDQLHGPIAEYFRGITSVTGRPPRAYGNAAVMQHLCGELKLFPDSWQCAAWSYPGTAPGTPINDGGYNLVLSPYASMLQNIGYVLGETSDHNSLMDADIGWMWGKEGEDVMTDDDFNKIASMVGAILDNRITNFATPHVILYDDKGEFEIVQGADGYRRRHVFTPAERTALAKANVLADMPLIDVRTWTEDERTWLYQLPLM